MPRAEPSPSESDRAPAHDSCVMRGDHADNSHSTTGFGAHWPAAIGTTVGLAGLVFVVAIVTESIVAVWVVLLLAAVCVAWDSANLEMHKYEGVWGRSPIGVFFRILVLWFVMLPLYLVARSQLLAGELPLRREYRPGYVPGEPSRAVNPHAFSDIRIAYLIVFLASFGGMALELTGTRVLAQHLGVSLFTWTGVIGVMLAGTAFGNLVGGVIADRANQPGNETSPRTILAGTLIVAAAGTILILVINVFGSHLLTSEKGFLASADPILKVLVGTFSMFFLPMFVLGMVSPQVIRLAVPDVAHVGRVAGRVYAWSTAGAIVGTFATGFGLLSTLGMSNTLMLVSLVLVLTPLLFAKVWEVNSLLYMFSIVLGGVTGGIILNYRSGREDGLLVQYESNYYTIRVTYDTVARYDENGDVIRDANGNVLFFPTGWLNLSLDALLHSSVNPADPRELHYTHEYVQMELLRGARARNPHPRVL
ncbi:MAG TPA: fused MFS/spermidine synthase, partial [Gemmata sp.]|nr:fused MFS/spermidine synthase [Gemmata sp.]